MNPLKEIIESSDIRIGKAWDLTIQSLIFISLISFTISTLPDLSAQTKQLLWFVELITVSIFTLEYILRLWVADSKPKFIFSFFGIVDFLAILPFYLSIGMDMRSLRVVRMLRLVRILKLVRYSDAIQRFHRAFIIVREELILFVSVTIILLYLTAVGIYYFENESQPDIFSSIFHSMWWAVATLTTVGYGDVYPITVGGKIFTTMILFIGLGIVAVPAGLFASALSQARTDVENEKKSKNTNP